MPFCSNRTQPDKTKSQHPASAHQTTHLELVRLPIAAFWDPGMRVLKRHVTPRENGSLAAHIHHIMAPHRGQTSDLVVMKPVCGTFTKPCYPCILNPNPILHLEFDLSLYVAFDVVLGIMSSSLPWTHQHLLLASLTCNTPILFTPFVIPISVIWESLT